MRHLRQHPPLAEEMCLALPVLTELAYSTFHIFLAYSAFQFYSFMSLHSAFLLGSSLLQIAGKLSRLLYFSKFYFSASQAMEEIRASTHFYITYKDLHAVCRNK